MTTGSQRRPGYGPPGLGEQRKPPAVFGREVFVAQKLRAEETVKRRAEAKEVSEQVRRDEVLRLRRQLCTMSSDEFAVMSRWLQTQAKLLKNNSPEAVITKAELKHQIESLAKLENPKILEGVSGAHRLGKSVVGQQTQTSRSDSHDISKAPEVKAEDMQNSKEVKDVLASTKESRWTAEVLEEIGHTLYRAGLRSVRELAEAVAKPGILPQGAEGPHFDKKSIGKLRIRLWEQPKKVRDEEEDWITQKPRVRSTEMEWMKVLSFLQGGWQSPDGEHLAFIEDWEITWVSGYSASFRLVHGEIVTTIEDEEYTAKPNLAEGTLIWSDGDTWVRGILGPPVAQQADSRRGEQLEAAMQQAPRWHAVFMDGEDDGASDHTKEMMESDDEDGALSQSGAPSEADIWEASEDAWLAAGSVPLSHLERSRSKASSSDGKGDGATSDIFALGGHSSGVAPYFAQRWTPVNSVLRLKPETGTWQVEAEMPSAKTMCATTLYRGILYVLGGFNGWQALNTCSTYSLASRTWTSLPHMSTGRAGAGAAAVNGFLHVIGGVGPRAPLKPGITHEFFDIALGEWTPMQPISLGRSPTLAVVAKGSAIYLAAGCRDTAKVVRFCTRLGRWEQLPPVKPSLAKCEFAGAAVVKDRIFFSCGRMLALRVFNTATMSWEPPPSTGGLPAVVGSNRAVGMASSRGSVFILGSGRWRDEDSGDAPEEHVRMVRLKVSDDHDQWVQLISNQQLYSGCSLTSCGAS